MLPKPPTLPLGPMARIVGVPAAWLRAEAEAGRIPHLRAGKVLQFDPITVERTLLDRAGREGVPGHE
jgi:hypothetical protein